MHPTCNTCKASLSEISDRCHTCGADTGAPNVRSSEATDELAALTSRYARARAEAVSRGAEVALDGFEAAVRHSVAVVNVSIDFLKGFVTDQKSLYANYHQGVRSSTRRVASLERDRNRTGVDALIFGGYGDRMSFAALSLVCDGLRSYGQCCMQLRDVAVAARASLLEENSYEFVKRHKLQPDQPIPRGYRSTWPNRGLLAVAKLGYLVQSTTLQKDFQTLLLSSDTKTSDDFIEIHIFGPFDSQAIERVSIVLTGDPLEAALWAVTKNAIRTAGKVAEEL